MANPLTSLDTARMASSDAAGAAVQSKLGSLKMTSLSPEEKAKKLREACEGFESIFIQKMWQEMRKSVHQSTLLHSRDEQFWQDMYDQELAKKMTSVGGIGLADMMFEQLSSHLTSASRTTALASRREQSFIPAQAPLLDEPLEKKEGEDLLAVREPLYEKPDEPEASVATVASLKDRSPQPPLPPLTAPTSTPVVPLAQTKKIEPQVVIPPISPAQQAVKKAKQTAQVSRPTVQSSSPQAAAVGEKPSPWLLVEELQQMAAQKPAGGNSVENALASMRAQVQADRILRPASTGNPEALASVSYDQLNRRQQPVASGIELANAAKRQAGDQLGSRGIREPLLPQTQKAKDSTSAAYTKREAQPNDGTVTVQPLPYSHPMNQAAMDDAAFSQQRPVPSSEAFVQNNPMVQQTQSPFVERTLQPEQKTANPRRVQRTNSDRRIRRQQKDNGPAIRTLNLDQPAGASLIGTSPQVPESNAKQVAGNESFTIPPLTAMDLGS